MAGIVPSLRRSLTNGNHAKGIPSLLRHDTMNQDNTQAVDNTNVKMDQNAELAYVGQGRFKVAMETFHGNLMFYFGFTFAEAKTHADRLPFHLGKLDTVSGEIELGKSWSKDMDIKAKEKGKSVDVKMTNTLRLFKICALLKEARKWGGKVLRGKVEFTDIIDKGAKTE